MDELPPIRSMSLTQQRIREALKNAPPLTIAKKTDEDFVFFDKNAKNENSLFNRFLKHKTIAPKSCPESESKQTGYKWSQLKDKMTEELEIKRMESQKHKEINDKIENEELDDELKDELTSHLDKDNNEDNRDDQNDASDEEEEEEEELEDEDISDEEEESSDEEVDEEIEDDAGDNEDEESEREVNPFVDDEAEDSDEEVMKVVDTNLETNDSRESFFISPLKKTLFAAEDCNEDNGLNDNVLDTSHSVLDESFDRKCATQKIALSPFITQKPKQRFGSNQDFSELISDFHLNNEEFNSQSLLDLCSGNFTENVKQICSQTRNESENNNNDSDDEQTQHNSDSEEEEEEDKEVLNRQKKVFNIESDNESDPEDIETDLKTTEEIKTSVNRFNGSDGEDLIVTDEEDEGQTEENFNEKEFNVNTFFDDEAELSGSEVSSDEDDPEDEDQEEDEAEQEDLPSDSEIEEQNKKYFNKQILDEEKREIMIMKERLFEDGDLHDGGRQREKKFRWNFDTDDNFVNDYINEDSDDNYMDSDEDEKTKTPTLKLMSDNNSDMKTQMNTTLDKLKSNFKKSFDLKNINKNVTSEAKSASISAFVVRDERLKTIMSFQSKRSNKSKNSFKSNKRLKSSKETKTSIFDLLNPINN